jgi:hypothetical protein
VTTSAERLLPTGLADGDAYCLAYDWLGRNLYVGMRLSRTIEAISTNKSAGSYRAIIVSQHDARKTNSSGVPMWHSTF